MCGFQLMARLGRNQKRKSLSARDDHQALAFNGKLWLIGGEDSQQDYLNDVWTSTDGISWTQQTTDSVFSARYGDQALVFDDKLWVIGGRDRDQLNDVWSSADGISWMQQRLAHTFMAKGGHKALVFDDKLWVIGGYHGNGVNDIWSSADGPRWTPAETHQALLRDGFIKRWCLMTNSG